MCIVFPPKQVCLHARVCAIVYAARRHTHAQPLSLIPHHRQPHSHSIPIPSSHKHTHTCAHAQVSVHSHVSLCTGTPYPRYAHPYAHPYPLLHLPTPICTPLCTVLHMGLCTVCEQCTGHIVLPQAHVHRGHPYRLQTLLSPSAHNHVALVLRLGRSTQLCSFCYPGHRPHSRSGCRDGGPSTVPRLLPMSAWTSSRSGAVGVLTRPVPVC